jgi:hypothetical protein
MQDWGHWTIVESYGDMGSAQVTCVQVQLSHCVAHLSQAIRFSTTVHACVHAHFAFMSPLFLTHTRCLP